MSTTPGRLGRGVVTRGAVAALALTTALALGGCGSSSAPNADSTASAGQSTAAPLTLSDGWVKAVESVGMSSGSMSPSASPMGSPSASSTGGMDMSAPMTAMFGTLRNTSGSQLTVTGGSCAAAGMVQLHETVKNADGTMQMQQKKGGFVIPAGGSFVLQPGGNHVMLMDLTQPLKNGDTVAVTLETSAGPVSFTVPIRTFTGGNETYQASPSS